MVSEMEEKLNAVLSNGDIMQQIMSIARSIGGEEQPSQPKPEPNMERVQPPPERAQPDLSAMIGMLSGVLGGGTSGTGGSAAELPSIDPRLIKIGMQLLSEYNRVDDKNVALLAALRPFLKEERQAKMDKAVRIARLTRVARAAMETFGGNGGGTLV